MNPTPLYICATACFHCTPNTTDSELKRHLKQHYGIDTRRLSRLSLLSLSGALLLAQQTQIAPQTALYLAASFGSPSVFHNMMENVWQHHIAKPLDFLAHLHNAPVFHTAAALQTQGASVFQAITPQPASWFMPLMLASNNLIANALPSTLVGWCYEAQPNSPHTQEGSCWLLIQSATTAPAAQLHIGYPTDTAHAFVSSSPHYLTAISQLCHQLSQMPYHGHLPTEGQISLTLHSQTSIPCYAQQF